MTASRYVSIALACSLVGMLFGGWWCDLLTRRFGQALGTATSVPIWRRCRCGAYLLCPALGSPLAVAVASGVVSFATDSVVPAVWALAQDIGGTHVASTLAWSNMWGNLGASAVAKVIPVLLASSFHLLIGVKCFGCARPDSSCLACRPCSSTAPNPWRIRITEQHLSEHRYAALPCRPGVFRGGPRSDGSFGPEGLRSSFREMTHAQEQSPCSP